MPDKNLTNWMIKKALECCITSDCRGCPLGHRATGTYNEHCGTDLMKNALDLINRLQAENERLKKFALIRAFDRFQKEAKAEAYKEFAERLHEELRIYGTKDKFNKSVFLNVVDKAKKELVGEDNESKN